MLGCYAGRSIPYNLALKALQFVTYLIHTMPFVQQHKGWKASDGILLCKLPVGFSRLTVNGQDVQNTPVPLHKRYSSC